MKATYVHQKTIVTTKEGTEVLEPGDITKEDVPDGDKVQQLHGAPALTRTRTGNQGVPLRLSLKIRSLLLNAAG